MLVRKKSGGFLEISTCMHVPTVASHIQTVPSWLPVNKMFPTVCHLIKIKVLAQGGGGGGGQSLT